MTEVPAEVAERIRRDPDPELNVLEGSTPVVFFGHQPSARVASLGINPSNQEFTTSRGSELSGEKRRFETLGSLEIASNSAADESQVEAVYERCLNYFTDPDAAVPGVEPQPRPTAYWRWFRELEAVLNPLAGASYLDGSACHLDLVQWATQPNWGGLAKQTRETLLQQDEDFLRGQLQNPRLEIVYLNGKSVCDQFRKVPPDAPLTKRTGVSPADRKITFYRGWYADTRIVGASYNLQNSRNPNPREAVRDWLVEECRKDLQALEDERA